MSVERQTTAHGIVVVNSSQKPNRGLHKYPENPVLHSGHVPPTVATSIFTQVLHMIWCPHPSNLVDTSSE